MQMLRLLWRSLGSRLLKHKNTQFPCDISGSVNQNKGIALRATKVNVTVTINRRWSYLK